MEWVALAFGLIGAMLAGAAGVVAFRDRTRPLGQGFFSISEKGGAAALLTIASAAAVALSAVAGALALILR